VQRLITFARLALHGSAVLLFVTMVALVIAQVVARKFFEPLVWSEELARYLFIWVAFIGWVIATERRSHVAIGLLSDRAGPVLARALRWFSDAATLLLMAWLLRYGWQLVQNNRDVETVTLFFNYALVYAAAPFAALAIAAITLARMGKKAVA
jgi:TRAP-type C4-dicarboxylate transport system permease small subunit